MTGKILGFVPIRENKRGALVTACFVMCEECHEAIRSMGGPITGALCIDCAEEAIKEINGGTP